MATATETQTRSSAYHGEQGSGSARSSSPSDAHIAFASIAILFGNPDKSRIFGLVSSHPGEGVTSAAKSLQAFLSHELNCDSTVIDLENMSSDEARIRLAQMRARNEAILVDCGSLETSARFLHVAPSVDGFILVMAAGKNTKTDVASAISTIQAAGSSIVATLLTKVRASRGGWLSRLLS